MDLQPKYKNLLTIILLAVIVFLAYGKTSQMYFWQDDSALMFKLQHLQEDMGSFGPGLLGTGAYRYLIVPFYPLHPLFGLNPTPYFVGAIILYFIATIIFWRFAVYISQNKSIGLIAALVFASGFMGSATFYRIINSYQTTLGFIFTTFTLWAWAKYLYRSRKSAFGGWYFYLLALALFLWTIETVFIRSHGVVFWNIGA